MSAPELFTVPPLRSMSAHAAIQLAIQEAERLGFRFETQPGAWQASALEISYLMRGKDELIACGVGKGIGIDAIAGAYYEALESYYLSARVNSRYTPGAARQKEATDIAGQPGLANDLIIQRWAKDYPESMAACVIYSNAASSIWYPIFLGDPNYYRKPLPGDPVGTYRSMMRYSSSIGTAAGSNAREAQLSGLCELIEHDALSHALLHWIVARMPRYDIVRVNTLSDSLKLIHNIACEAVGAEVLLLDVTTDIGVPAYLAVKDCDSEAGPVGAGASLVGEHAVARALSEFIQVAVLSDGRELRTAGARLRAWPVLQECVLLSPRTLGYRSAEQVSVRRNVGDINTIETCLDTLSDLLRQHGICFYSCELTPPNSLISVVSTIAPGLERFSLVRSGIPIIPTGRGWSLWSYR